MALRADRRLMSQSSFRALLWLGLLTVFLTASGAALFAQDVSGQANSPSSPTEAPPATPAAIAPDRIPLDPCVIPDHEFPLSPPPAWLPRYNIQLRVDTEHSKVTAREVVVWTNPGKESTDHLLFHVYPRYSVAKKDRVMLERTLESFRLDSKSAYDQQGRRIDIKSVTSGAVALKFQFDEKIDTLLRVELPAPVAPGASVEIALEFTLDLPPVQGRLGQHKGVTNLLNWYPLVAYYGDKGWEAFPYVAWHQPWLNEAGFYDVTLEAPTGEEIASGATIVERGRAPDGWQRVTLKGDGIRDLAITLSKRYEVMEAKSGNVLVRVLAFPHHRLYARQALQTAVECLTQYSRWFGPYPYSTFTIAEAYFGWNGNETGGMVLIDERVFDAPSLGHAYIDHLISHEIAHQWWYGAVGTDGFRETWMDEGLVSHLTQMRIRAKYGNDLQLLDWPRHLGWLPNIPYHTFMHYGYYLYRSRGGHGQVLAPLPDIGNVYNLFFLAYERGGQVFGMIRARLGDERFFRFLQMIYAKYRFRVLFVDALQRELENFSGDSWQEFFDDWLRSPKVTDWKIEKAKTKKVGDQYQTTVVVKQVAEIFEPTVIGVEQRGEKKDMLYVALDPKSKDYVTDTGSVRKLDDKRYEVVVHTKDRPRQIMVDPDGRLEDANVANNRWRMDTDFALTPFYNPLDETWITRPMGRPSFRAGPGIDNEGRIGLRGALIEPYKYRISPLLAYGLRSTQLTGGLDSEFLNVPLPNLSIGARYEQTIASDLYNDPQAQGKFYLRWTNLYTTSFLYPNLVYLESYFRFGDNFFAQPNIYPPRISGIEDYRNIRSVGITYHFDTRYPYWNPEKGVFIEANAETGLHIAGKGESYNRGSAQFSAVHTLPDTWGWLSETRLVGRVAGGFGSPDNGEHFRFGGPFAFRGQHLEDTEGNAFWLASVDWRFPLLEEIHVPLHDNLAIWKSLYAAILYDVGNSFLFDQSQGLDHAVGMGLYFRFGLFSFVEQLTLRLEFAHSLIRDSTITWFGMYQAF